MKLVNGAGLTNAQVLHRDGLGSVRAITNATGARIEGATYKPYGEQMEPPAVSQPAPETKGWIGERYDADAGLQYLNARYYDPELGMFAQPDWWEVTKPGVGTNRYAYSFGDPVNKMDPGGNCVWDACIAEVVTAAAIVSSFYAVDSAIDISNGGQVGDSPLGNPIGRAVQSIGEGLGSDTDGGPGKIGDGLFAGIGGRVPGQKQNPRSVPQYEAGEADINDILAELERQEVEMKEKKPGVYVGELADGTKVIAYEESSAGSGKRPTLQLQDAEGRVIDKTRLREPKDSAKDSDESAEQESRDESER